MRLYQIFTRVPFCMRAPCLPKISRVHNNNLFTIYNNDLFLRHETWRGLSLLFFKWHKRCVESFPSRIISWFDIITELLLLSASFHFTRLCGWIQISKALFMEDESESCRSSWWLFTLIVCLSYCGSFMLFYFIGHAQYSIFKFNLPVVH